VDNNVMKVDDIDENDFVERKRTSLARVLPSVITVSAFCFGLTSIRFALFHKWELAVLCVFVASLLDAFDGRVARILGQSSHFGAELDSLSDLVCFGVAPSLILFLKTMYFMENFGWGICMFFTVCCALRLARFNATMNEEKPDWTKKYFSGVPAPAGAILALFPLILFFATSLECFLNSTFVSFCMLSSGALMVSVIKTFSSKMIEIKKRFVSPELLAIIMIVICLITALWITLAVLVSAYILAIPYGTYHYAKKEKESAVSQSN
jgi:CDP-diacylglycerol--serine O-phosphatidyltransferase